MLSDFDIYNSSKLHIGGESDFYDCLVNLMKTLKWIFKCVT